jgi:hypothetical protein
MRIFLIVLATLLGLAGPAYADWRRELKVGDAAYLHDGLYTAIAH